MIGLLTSVLFGTSAGRAVLVGFGLLTAFKSGELLNWWQTPPARECECKKERVQEKDIFLNVLERLLKGL